MEPSAGTLSGAVLVVDDNPRMADLARRELVDDGYEVVVAGSAASALALARERPFALALSDFAMPGGDGLMLLKQLRKLRPRTRCVLWSASLPGATAQAAAASGVTVLPAKLLGDDLRACVRAAVSASRLRPLHSCVARSRAGDRRL